MKRFDNLTQVLIGRENDERYGQVMVNRHRITEDFVKRLGLIGELDGHSGCVNCLEWNSDGRLLASGSDDIHICIWDAFRRKNLCSIPTGHHGNVFSVKFVPNTGDRHLVSGAADHAVRIHDSSVQECFRVCTCHSSRVKRIATDISTPHLFWSAGEDGLILQHDLRVSHSCSSDPNKPRNVLVDLKSYIGGKAEAKCLSLNPVQSEIMAVGASDPYIRLYDRRMIKLKFRENEDGSVSTDSHQIPSGAVKYFVPGHLPSKMSDYGRKYRSLASTYVEFSPDGSELLANLGGEQIYLFPLRNDLQKDYTELTLPNHSEGYDKSHTRNGHTNGFKKQISIASQEQVNIQALSQNVRPGITIPECARKIQIEANEAFESRKFSRAIQLYNEALLISPNSSILLANRAAALLKRAWDGDVYVALRDCYCALKIDPAHHKAYLRLCRSLFELSRHDEALSKHTDFKRIFPDFANTTASKKLEADLSKAMKKEDPLVVAADTSDHSFFSTSTSSSSAQSASTPTSPPSRRIHTRDIFFRFSSGSPDSSNSAHSEDVEAQMSSTDDALMLRSSTEEAGSDNNEDPPRKKSNRHPKYQEAEVEFRSKAVDFAERYCGHCNTTTDIKEANFFGNYIVAGSDDGSFFIWDRKTTNIVKILRGDESIVNCLQPHPSTCLLATSGIEQVIRLWAPLPEDGSVNDRVITEWNDVASENQKRMNTNPFEVILMNMGYRINANDDPSDEDEGTASSARSGVQCNQT